MESDSSKNYQKVCLNSHLYFFVNIHQEKNHVQLKFDEKGRNCLSSILYVFKKNVEINKIVTYDTIRHFRKEF